MLKIEDIRLRLGGFILQNISLHVRPGEYLVLLGPTGTGKTVLLETIAGIHRPSLGRIRINGKDATRLPPENRNLGVVYQDYALFPNMTVKENIGFGLKVRGLSRKKVAFTINDMVEFLEIAPILDRKPARLSGGERQRVALARALVLRPHALLLDEPLSALDGFTRERLRRELKRIHQELSITVFHITHDLSEAFFLAERLAVMKDGRILQADDPQTVRERPVSRMVAELVGIANLIEGEVKDGRLLTPLGPVDLQGFTPRPPAGRGQACLTVPAGSVEIFPLSENAESLWEGSLQITGIGPMDSPVNLELTGPGGQVLKTTLSPRELRTYTGRLAIGNHLPVAILREGVYWV